MDSISFVGVATADGECFCWTEVQRGDKVAIIGQESYDADRRLQEDFRKSYAYAHQEEYDAAVVEHAMETLYPGDVMLALGAERGKKYKFTISAEEI